MIAIEWSTGPRKFAWAELYGAFGLLAPLVAWLYPHVPLLQAAWPGCNFRSVTGYPCGTCGFTRAFVRSAHGHLGDALAVSPLGTVIFFAWVFFGIVVIGTWLVPSIPRPRVVFPGVAGRWLARLGLPLVFLVNWGWLCWLTFRHGAPPA